MITTKYMDNRKLSPSALEHLSQRAGESVIIHGLTQIKACKVFGFSETSMCKYIKAYKEDKEASYNYKKRGVALGTGSKLDKSQIDALITKILTNTPDELGMEYALWTSKAVHEYIESTYEVSYNRRSIRKILTKLGFTSQKPIKCIEFLGRMIRQIKQKVFLILDNHRVHHSKKVKAYVAKHKEKLELFYLPPYCPDMNPQELVNQDVKANSNNFRALKSINDLTINLRYYLTQIQFNQFKIMNHFTKKEVAYAAH